MSVRILSSSAVALRPLALGFLLLGLVFALAGPAFAQPVAQVYPAKFVCGFERGDVPLLSADTPFPHKYEELKPGNYATLINILNVDFSIAQQSFTPAVVIDGLGPIGLLTRTLTPLQMTQVGCPEIMAGLTPFLPALPVGEVFEGYVTIITTPNDPLQVDTVFTFETKDAFEKHFVYGTDENLILQNRLLSLIFGGFKFGNFPPVGVFPATDIAGSGAGGLGLGAAMDVVRVEPRDIITTPGLQGPLAPFLKDLPKQ